VSLGSVPERWWRVAVRRRWFRNLFCSAGPDGPEPPRTYPDPRVVPAVVGPPHRDDPLTAAFVAALEEEATHQHVAASRGVKTSEVLGPLGCPFNPPWRRFPPRMAKTRRMRGVYLTRHRDGLKRVWITPVLEWFTHNRPDLLADPNASSDRTQVLTASWRAFATWPDFGPPSTHPSIAWTEPPSSPSPTLRGPTARARRDLGSSFSAGVFESEYTRWCRRPPTFRGRCVGWPHVQLGDRLAVLVG
jgi:hypothetical protein